MRTVIAITLSAYNLGCEAAFAVNLSEFIKHADDYPAILAGVIISVLTCALSWIAVGCFIYSKIRKKNKK